MAVRRGSWSSCWLRFCKSDPFRRETCYCCLAFSLTITSRISGWGCCRVVESRNVSRSISSGSARSASSSLKRVTRGWPSWILSPNLACISIPVRARRPDRLGFARAACPEALNGPAHLFAVHIGEVAGGSSLEDASGVGFVMRRGIFEDADIATLRLDDLRPCFIGGSAAENLVGKIGACLRCCCGMAWR